MVLYANFRKRVNADKVSHVKRSLLGQGKLSVSVGQEVAPHDVLGQYYLVGGFSSFNLAKKLNVSPKEAPKYLQKQIGAQIFEGELLALKKGFLGNTIVTSPADGVIDFYDESRGELRLKFISKPIQLTSGVYGIVERVDKALGEVTIKSLVTEVYGVIGSGKERSGILNILGQPDTLLSKNFLNSQSRQKIVVVGSIINSELLKKAASLGVYGIVGGGIDARDFKSMTGAIHPYYRVGTDVGITINCTEGFGAITMGPDVFQVLKSYEGKFVFISGNTPKLLLPTPNPDSIMGLRKTALPKTGSVEKLPEIFQTVLKIGAKVRIIGMPFRGHQGVVEAIDQTVTLMESGIATYMILVNTPSRKMKVPYPNIEVVD